ncbi:hypothetical protein D3C85_1795200 [compost metagenome]
MPPLPPLSFSDTLLVALVFVRDRAAYDRKCDIDDARLDGGAYVLIETKLQDCLTNGVFVTEINFRDLYRGARVPIFIACACR